MQRLRTLMLWCKGPRLPHPLVGGKRTVSRCVPWYLFPSFVVLWTKMGSPDVVVGVTVKEGWCPQKVDETGVIRDNSKDPLRVR